MIYIINIAIGSILVISIEKQTSFIIKLENNTKNDIIRNLIW
jgi:hypothetical protein